MERTDAERTDASLGYNGRTWVWLAGSLALLLWQAWLALGLFGNAPWDALTDDRPVISGSHPQHFYLGSLGARGLAQRGTTCVYDPAFQAGYPKTPIFNGSRLAEVFLFLGGADGAAASYKIGLFVVCLLVPLLLLTACACVRLPPLAAFCATATGILLWWGPTGRTLLEAGEYELLLAALALLTHAAVLVRYDRSPGLLSWLALVATASLGWFCQPLLFPIALPLLLMYYLMAGIRHATFSWHLGLAGAQVLGVGLNLPWLIDWVDFWWLRSSLPGAADLLRHRTVGALWNAPLWGGPADRGLAVFLLASSLVGISVWNLTKQRVPARILGLGAAGLLTLALLGISWEPLGQLGTATLLVPALWFASLPAAHAWQWLIVNLARGGVPGRLALTGIMAGIGVAVFFWVDDFLLIGRRCLYTEPLQIGLGAEREATVRKLIEHTGPEARILWEDRPLPRKAPRWSALLPTLTGRYFLGGLDPDGTIEHSSISFVDQTLEGQPIASWSDQALEEYCRRYNVGWIAAWSPATIKRLSEWDGAAQVTDLSDGVPGYLFLVKRAPRDYALKGKAHIVQADGRHITLAEVVPENGVVVLSLHYQTGLRATPSRVQVERESCGHDPIGFLRLRVAGPVARVTLTWGGR